MGRKSRLRRPGDTSLPVALLHLQINVHLHVTVPTARYQYDFLRHRLRGDRCGGRERALRGTGGEEIGN